MSVTRSTTSLGTTFVVTAYDRHEHVSGQPRVRIAVEVPGGGPPTITPEAATKLARQLVELAALAVENGKR